jgi:undecaprenyl-phosphate 4-deoxy-4-formamido-L-arabinose transferase
VVEHEERAAGESKYSLYSLIRLNFDLVTGFSLVPLQFYSMMGIFMSIISGLLVLVLLVRRLFLGAEAEGVFTLFAISFFFMGVILFGIGLLGEYIGRIYQQVRARPRYVVQTILQQKSADSMDLPPPGVEKRTVGRPHE